MSTVLAIGLTSAAALGGASTAAADVTVPIQLQAELLAKVVLLDRSYAERAGTEARVLVVEAPGRGDSHGSAGRLLVALGTLETLGGVPHIDELVAFTDPEQLAEHCRSSGASIVYMASSFSEEEIRAIAVALDSVSILSAAAVPGDVEAGVVVGFDLVSGKPRILVNLAQAQRQGVGLASTLLGMATVYR